MRIGAPCRRAYDRPAGVLRRASPAAPAAGAIIASLTAADRPAPAELSVVVREDEILLVGPSQSGDVEVRLRPASAADELAALLSADTERATDSLLALAGLVAVARGVVSQQHVRLGTRGGLPCWQADPDDADRKALLVAVERVLRAAYGRAHGRPLLADTLQRFAADVSDAVARRLPLPAALQPFADQQLTDGQAADIEAWHERVTVRRAADGARLAVVLDPPEGGDESWIATAVVAEGGTNDVHPLLEPSRMRIPGVDDDTTAELIDVELRAAKAAAGRSTAGLFTAYAAELSGTRLLRFVDVIAELEAAGIEVRAPKGIQRNRGLRTRVSVSGDATGMAERSLRLTVAADLDGVVLTAAEIHQLAAAQAPFIQLGSQWVRVPSGAKDAARLLDRARRGVLAASELLDEQYDGFDVDADGVSGWVGRALRFEADLSMASPVPAPAGVRAQLRHYQLDGLAWLTWCEANDVGGILADDMGLGKTLQLLTRIEADHPGPTLVVCPTTLLDNWRREAARFTPGLRVAVHHGGQRDLLRALGGADVVLTTYALLVRDPEFAEIDWHRVILDEAQAIKNPAARAAQAARRLSARHRFAVTGTPVENHLGDLWSLMAFAQPGLLGSFAKFRRRYLTTNGRNDEERLARLRAVVRPFLLRRSKRDKSVLPDLPDKIELRHDCGLTREQVGVYETVVRKLEAEAKAATGTKRRGVVLAGLTRLKQACVHPQLALGTHRGGLTSGSGKLAALAELIEEAVAEDDALLVFSQYATFLPPLARYLSEALDLPCLRLDGSMAPARRTAVVDEFSAADGPPVLLASLKAGGTGLNLVRANHVVHLDRWWNPAVEDQGSDRAWRLGQTRNVMVHTLVCPGTIEERIAHVLAAKRQTAGTIVGDDPAPAVTELSDADLRELVELVRDEHILLRSG